MRHHGTSCRAQEALQVVQSATFHGWLRAQSARVGVMCPGGALLPALLVLASAAPAGLPHSSWVASPATTNHNSRGRNGARGCNELHVSRESSYAQGKEVIVLRRLTSRVASGGGATEVTRAAGTARKGLRGGRGVERWRCTLRDAVERRGLRGECGVSTADERGCGED